MAKQKRGATLMNVAQRRTQSRPIHWLPIYPVRIRTASYDVPAMHGLFGPGGLFPSRFCGCPYFTWQVGIALGKDLFGYGPVVSCR